jgi:hypothetical protein
MPHTPFFKVMEESVFQQVASGALSGIVADVVTHPLSTVKTRLQVQGSGGSAHGAVAYRGVTHAFWQIATTEGPMALYRGLGIVLVAATPGQALYFAGYELAKNKFGRGDSSIGNFMAGSCAQLCGSLAWVPMDVTKERLQVEGQVKVLNTYSGSFNAFASILKAEGLLGIYRAFPIHQMTWVPFHGVYFALYEKCKQLCVDAGYADEYDTLEPTAQICSTFTAGMIASGITNPLDVLKTRLQVSRANPQMFPYNNSWVAFRHLLHHEGASALLNGTVARIVWFTPRMMICVKMRI